MVMKIVWASDISVWDVKLMGRAYCSIPAHKEIVPACLYITYLAQPKVSKQRETLLTRKASNTY